MVVTTAMYTVCGWEGGPAQAKACKHFPRGLHARFKPTTTHRQDVEIVFVVIGVTAALAAGPDAHRGGGRDAKQRRRVCNAA